MNYMKSLPDCGPEYISATMIADALKLNHVLVRKDLASFSTSGKPKVGYVKTDLMNEIERYLGYDDAHDAVIVGAGKLGKALLAYEGFQKYGLNIVAAFDRDAEAAAGSGLESKIFPMERLQELCGRMNIRIGIITVPYEQAQQVCNLLIESGILAVWNFAPIHLIVPEGILVQNENMASSLALLSKHLTEKLRE